MTVCGILCQVSCVEYLCDSLCYRLDLASFVACVNSGKSWNSKSSLMLSAKEQLASSSEDAENDPFVENFVLERLSVQSPLRVSPQNNYVVIFEREEGWTTCPSKSDLQ